MSGRKQTPEWLMWAGLVALLVAAPIIGAAVGTWIGLGGNQ